MPIVIFLIENGIYKISFNEVEYPKVNPSLIFTKKYSDDKIYYDNDDAEMKRLLIRCYSIHNELGDSFSIGEGENENNYDLTQRYFPFNLNICCIGRFGQGKSTGVNALLNEYKAKESSRGEAQTKKAIFYQSSYAPIKILDVPGYDSEENIKLSIDKFRYCAEEINRLKDYIHIFLYFLKDTDDRTISKFESIIFEELIKNQKSKIIYVVTHSHKKKYEERKKESIKKINDGIKSLDIINEENKNLIIQNMGATEDNVVFVNFHKDHKLDREPFGRKELFKKISDIFKNSDFYRDSYKNVEPSELNNQIKLLKEKANSILINNKIGGALIGALPFVDLLVQNFVIKKQVARKLGSLFGIDIKYIENKKYQEEKNEIELDIISSETQELENCENLAPENDLDMVSEQNSEKKRIQQINDSEDVNIRLGVTNVFTKAATGAGEVVVQSSTVAASTALKAVGMGFIAVGCIVGVGIGAYFTSNHCKEMINKFAEFYKENVQNIHKSYLNAITYLEDIEEFKLK